MEIRILPRQSGVTTWLVSTMMNNVVRHPGSEHFLIYPTYEALLLILKRIGLSWDFKDDMVEIEVGNHCTIYAKACESQHLLEKFMENHFHSLSKMIVRTEEELLVIPSKRFMYIDMVEAYGTPDGWSPRNLSVLKRPVNVVNGMAWNDMLLDDMYIGGTVEGEGSFVHTLPFKHFTDEYNMYELGEILCHVFDFIKSTEFDGKEYVSFPNMESDECLECKNRYTGCLRLGNMMRVRKECDRYDELFIMSLTGNKDNGDDKRDSI